MTLLLTFEALEEKRINLSTKFRVSEKAATKGGSTMILEKNQQVSVEDLIKGISIVSGNDACIVIAEGLNGTEESFVKRMNLKAKDIGLTNSNFNNSTGWPSPGHVMSVRDLLKIAILIREKYPNYYNYFLETKYTWNDIWADYLKETFIRIVYWMTSDKNKCYELLNLKLHLFRVYTENNN